VKLDLLYTEDYPYPLEKVWAALIDPVALADWLMPNDFEPKVGKHFTLRCPPKPGSRGRFDCVVLELAPPTKMVWSWQGSDEDEPSRLEFHLERIEIWTRLKLIHTGETDPAMLGLLSEGGPAKIKALREYLNR
jgi:uncharacterized protein YndB with AHSA1/START domain